MDPCNVDRLQAKGGNGSFFARLVLPDHPTEYYIWRTLAKSLMTISYERKLCLRRLGENARPLSTIRPLMATKSAFLMAS